MKSEAPSRVRVMPRTLDEFSGEEHIIGEGKLLRRAIEGDKLFSVILSVAKQKLSKTELGVKFL